MDQTVAQHLAAETEAGQEYYRLKEISDRYYKYKKVLLSFLATSFLLGILAWQFGPIGATVAILLTVLSACITLAYIAKKPDDIDAKVRQAKIKHDQYLLETHYYMQRQMHNLPVY